MGTSDFKASFAAVARVREEQLERAREEGREEIRALVRAFVEAESWEEYRAVVVDVGELVAAIEPKP